MKTITLPDGTPTSQIGMGCAGLLAGASLADSTALVHAALEAGIRHFDVAPIYGSGLAEDALGSALAGTAEMVTITTKVGLARPAAPRASSGLRRLAKAALGAAPGLKARLGRQVYAMSRRTAFGVDEVEASLCDSLRRLRRERVDVVLLHDPTAEDLTEELLRWIKRVRADGRAGSVGIGADQARLPELLAIWPDAAFVQTAWTPGEPRPPAGDRFLSTHGALRGLPALRARLAADPILRHQLTGENEAAISGERLAALALGGILAGNPHGLMLVASSKASRLRAAAAATSVPAS